MREDLEVIRAEVKAVTPPPSTRRSTARVRTANLDMEAKLRELTRTAATHAFRGMDAVELTLRISASPAALYGCIVKTPTGGSLSGTTAPSSKTFLRVNTYKLVYPNEFRDSGPLEPGRYEVEWRKAAVDSGGGSELLVALSAMVAKPDAVDSFTIPAPQSEDPPRA